MNAVTGAYAVGDIDDMKTKLHEGLTETGKYSPGKKLTLPDIPFDIKH